MTLHLHVSNEIKDNKTVRTTILSCDDKKTKPVNVFYEFDRIVDWSEDTPVDGNIYAVLLYAMSLGLPLHVHGAVTKVAIRSIEELQNVWSKWRRDTYKKIEVIPDRIITVDRKAGAENAISAFSGGIDAIFTALQHTKNLPEHLRYPITSVLTVHGFDVDLYNYDDFNKLTARVAPLLQELNLEQRTVRTNSRDLKIQYWSDSCGLELAACMCMLGSEFDVGLIGSSSPHDKVEMPWGSTPLTDNLIKSGHFSIFHDGAGLNRTEKIALIAKHGTSCVVAKVCWAGVDQSLNCGKCEKCLRTRLNFWAAGYQGNLPCFPDNFTLDLIKNVNLDTNSHRSEMQGIVDYARKHGATGEWIKALQNRLDVWKPTDLKIMRRKEHGSHLKRLLKKIIFSIGLGESTKKLWRKSRRKLLKD